VVMPRHKERVYFSAHKSNGAKVTTE